MFEGESLPFILFIYVYSTQFFGRENLAFKMFNILSKECESILFIYTREELSTKIALHCGIRFIRLIDCNKM